MSSSRPAPTTRPSHGARNLQILVLGASGFIGSAVATRLAAEGHEVVEASRHPRRAGLNPARQIAIDVSRTTTVEHWLPHLRGIDAVVNCAGTLQDAPGDSTRGVHDTGVRALFAACEAAGVKRVIHFSAAGVERRATAFSESKLAGDQALMSRNLDWLILRPSVVIGRNAYGGSALMRGLAALPVLPVMPNTGPLQLVHLDDIVETVALCVRPDAPARQILDLAGPRTWAFADAVELLRRWLRFRKARRFTVPEPLGRALYAFGDSIALLGWRPPVRSTARREIVHGATGDASSWQRATGIAPRDIEAALSREPASVQERWFAQLYVLKPLVFGVFGLFWIVTGLISLGPGWDIGMGLMREGGVGEAAAVLAVVGGALADIVIGLAILYRPTTRLGLYAGLAISVAYAIIGTILVPRLWSDPLGPMLKIWPIMVLNLVALAIVDDR
jgi:uncharacterized protein YbjT (DUF2867 family)